jgi:hypothetical protein
MTECKVHNPGGAPCTKEKGHPGGHDLWAYGPRPSRSVPEVHTALVHVRSQHPNVTWVTFDEAGRWLYTEGGPSKGGYFVQLNDIGSDRPRVENAPTFSDWIDVDILQRAIDQVEELEGPFPMSFYFDEEKTNDVPKR